MQRNRKQPWSCMMPSVMLNQYRQWGHLGVPEQADSPFCCWMFWVASWQGGCVFEREHRADLIIQKIELQKWRNLYHWEPTGVEVVSTDAFESMLVSHRAGGTRYGHNQPPFLVQNRRKLQSTAVPVGLSVVRSRTASMVSPGTLWRYCPVRLLGRCQKRDGWTLSGGVCPINKCPERSGKTSDSDSGFLLSKTAVCQLHWGSSPGRFSVSASLFFWSMSPLEPRPPRMSFELISFELVRVLRLETGWLRVEMKA